MAVRKSGGRYLSDDRSFPVRADGTRFDNPAGSALGLLARTGSGWTFFDPSFKRPREQRWRIDMQKQIGPTITVSLAYAGMYASDLKINQRLDALPGQYWATGATRNDAIATNLNQNVPNPFYISNFSALQTSDPVLYQALASRSFFTSTTIRKNQLLRPFSQMSTLTETAGFGSVKAHSMEAVFQQALQQRTAAERELHGFVRARSGLLPERVRCQAELGRDEQRSSVPIHSDWHL